MPSLITSIIGGIQGASAAGNAGSTIAAGYNQAGSTLESAIPGANAGITSAASSAGGNVTGAGTAAGTGATSTANQLMQLLSPYISSGATASNQLSALTGPGGQMNQPFTASTMAQYSPAYQFQMQQGQQGLARAAAASGTTGSGGTLKALDMFNQNYAGTAFNNAFNQYQTQNTNQFNRLATLAGMGQQATEFGGNLGENAAQYAGNAGIGTQEWAGGANINAADLAAQNTIGGANYLANTQIGAANGIASGDLGAASAWNGMLGGIGQAGNTVMMAGMPSLGSPSGGWGFNNIGYNVSGGPQQAQGYF